MTVFNNNNNNNNKRIIITNLIILILEISYVEAFYLKDIYNDDDNNILNYYDDDNINNYNKNFIKLINHEKFQTRQDEGHEYYYDDDMLPFKSRTGFLVVMISSYLALYLNFVGTCYVLYRSFFRWKRNNNTSLPMTLRVPMYIALTDSFTLLTHLVNISHTASTQQPWDGSSCKIIGGLSFFFQFMNIFLVGGVALTTFLRVKKGRFFSLGKYDYKLFVGMLILSLSSTLAFNKNLGSNKYWCSADYDDKNLAIFSLCIISIVVTVSLFCYLSIIFEMRSIKIDEYFNGEEISEEISIQRKETNRRIYSKISSYILIFILQYVPVTIYNIGHITGIDHYWVYVVCDIGVNFGGIGNFVQYTINEGWTDKSDEQIDTYKLANYRGNRRSNRSRHSRNLNEDTIDSFGIIRPPSSSSSANTTTTATNTIIAEPKTNKKVVI